MSLLSNHTRIPGILTSAENTWVQSSVSGGLVGILPAQATALGAPDGLTTNWPIITVTWANLPAAASFQGRICRVSNLNNALFESNGTRWKPVNGRALIGSIDTDVTMTGTTETVMFQKLFPAGALRNGDVLSLVYSIGKSGTSETTSVGIRLGAAGTTADTSLSAFGPMTTTNQSAGLWAEYSRVSATSVEKCGSGANNSAFVGPAATTLNAPVTVANMDSNAVYLSLTMAQSAAVETATLRRLRLELISSGA